MYNSDQFCQPPAHRQQVQMRQNNYILEPQPVYLEYLLQAQNQSRNMHTSNSSMQQSILEPVIVRIVEQEPQPQLQLQHVYISPKIQHSSPLVHYLDLPLQQSITTNRFEHYPHQTHVYVTPPVSRINKPQERQTFYVSKFPQENEYFD